MPGSRSQHRRPPCARRRPGVGRGRAQEAGRQSSPRAAASSSASLEEEDHPAVPADPFLTDLLAEAVRSTGHVPHRMTSGAGHDAAVMATVAPMAMLFLRSPGGVSHHPDERVVADDVVIGSGSAGALS